eukprot:CAMPEP_0194508226 /NCGR_PEP_ID=MMETSP0253-20130528/38207_1 /TAXON_ID=2966 /ORGANISM="Noctiluca scintillans" /LENGTH=97 /DNA_ID=CAMNT_0039351227 /DNA_START=28 /DNA_END=318 /DNA_ORIENTATION=+
MRCGLVFFVLGVAVSQHQLASGGDYNYSECDQYLGWGHNRSHVSGGEGMATPGEGAGPPEEGMMGRGEGAGPPGEEMMGPGEGTGPPGEGEAPPGEG